MRMLPRWKTRLLIASTIRRSAGRSSSAGSSPPRATRAKGRPWAVHGTTTQSPRISRQGFWRATSGRQGLYVRRSHCIYGRRYRTRKAYHTVPFRQYAQADARHQKHANVADFGCRKNRPKFHRIAAKFTRARRPNPGSPFQIRIPDVYGVSEVLRRKCEVSQGFSLFLPQNQ